MKRHIMRSAALASMLVFGSGGIYVAKQYIADDTVRAQSPAEAESNPSADDEQGAAESSEVFAGGRLLDALNQRLPADPTAARPAPTPLPTAAGKPPAVPAPHPAAAPEEAEQEPNSPARDPFGIRVEGETAAAPLSPVEAEADLVHPLRGAPAEGDPLGRELPAGGDRYAHMDTAAVPVDQAPASRYAEVAPLRPAPFAEREIPAAVPVRESAEHAPASLPSRNHSLREPRSFTSNLTAADPMTHSPRELMPTSPQPGAAELDGAQSPSVQLHKTAPAEIQVGKPAEFRLVVRNTGQVSAHDVVVHDQIPQGTRLMATEPPAAEIGQGALQWPLGTLAPGEEQTLAMQVMPTDEGEIGSVASVSFRAEASVRTIATKPELLLEIAAPSKVMIDTPVGLKIKVSNPGSGEATGVVIYEDVPPQLAHPAGKELEFEVGNLQPNESREIELTLDAKQAGLVRNIVSVRGDANLEAQTEVQFEVIAPQLQVALNGPKLRYLEREATYTLSVTNPGTAPAKEIELVSHLPQGMEFVSANNAGQYDKATHSVHWSLAELPEGEEGSVELVALPVEAGEQSIRVEGKAEQGLASTFEEQITVEGIAALFFGVADVEDPIEVGGRSSYEIRIVNQGTKSADVVQMTAQLPAGLKPIQADGPTRGMIQGNQVVFEPLSRLAPKADTTYTIEFQGVAAGDQRVRIQVSSADMEQPVTKEESTRVYSDR